MALVNRNEDSPASNLLRILKRSSGLTIKEIEKEMGVTTNAVRLQLNKLMAEGLIESRRESRGRGRPHLIFTLTEKAQKVFPRNYEELLSVLLEKVLRIDSDIDKREAMEFLVEKMSERFGEYLKSDLPKERLLELASVLEERGIIVDILEEDEGLILKEFNCPYNEIAQSYPEICKIEKDTLSKILKSPVRLNHCLMDGDSFCQFHISRVAVPQ